MKDPTADILATFSTALTGQVTYDSETIPVVEDLADVKTYGYIWLKNVRATPPVQKCQDEVEHECEIDVEVGTGGFHQQASRAKMNSVVNQVVGAIGGVVLTYTNFYQELRPYPDIRTLPREKANNEIIYRTEITFSFTLQEK